MTPEARSVDPSAPATRPLTSPEKLVLGLIFFAFTPVSRKVSQTRDPLCQRPLFPWGIQYVASAAVWRLGLPCGLLDML